MFKLIYIVIAAASQGGGLVREAMPPILCVSAFAVLMSLAACKEPPPPKREATPGFRQAQDERATDEFGIEADEVLREAKKYLPADVAVAGWRPIKLRAGLYLVLFEQLRPMPGKPVLKAPGFVAERYWTEPGAGYWLIRDIGGMSALDLRLIELQADGRR